MAQPPIRPLIAGNWKMYKTIGQALQFTEDLAQRLQGQSSTELPEILLCPPFTALTPVIEASRRLSAPFAVGAQTMECHEEGAYTGEISPTMLVDVGVQYVILGHSERRQYYNETDASVHEKTVAALRHGLKPIVCVGETLEQREAQQTDAVITRQVQAALAGFSLEELKQLTFAYEPVWAIGTGKVCETPEANRVCQLIQTLIQQAGAPQTLRVLYGGSVKAENAQELLAQPFIHGALVGGASLKADTFLPIIQAGQPCLPVA